MKKINKFLAAILSLIMILSTCVIASASSGVDLSDLSDYPVIIVPGYSSSQLYVNDENGEREKVWGLDFQKALKQFFSDIVSAGKSLGALTVGDASVIADYVGANMDDYVEKIRCNADGSSTYDVKNYFLTADECNTANLKERYPDNKFYFEPDFTDRIGEIIGYENIFNFNCDFRMGAATCAAGLDALIQSVKEYTGKDKVNIYAISHGGQITATYLNLYGEKNDVDNAVLTVPAIGGAGIAYDCFTGNIDFDEELLIAFIENGFMVEDDYEWLLKAQQLGILDDIFKDVLPYLKKYAKYWGSLWDFLPVEYYEEMKAEMLDSDESAALIEKSDYFHYTIFPSMGEKLRACIDRGMNISIISGTDYASITGLKVNSDSIIPVSSSSGATCAPFGQRFADGYTQINSCDAKNKVSPSMEIDASTAYLPDNTWFVEKLFHGTCYFEDYSRSLVMKLLLTDEITDVYSSKEYPQFHASSNPASAVFASFNNSPEGFPSKDDTQLNITNECKEKTMKVLAVTVDGADISFNLAGENKYLKPGDTMSLDIIGDLPQVSGKLMTVTVSYRLVGSVTPYGERTFCYTINNGDKVVYDGGYVGDCVTQQSTQTQDTSTGYLHVLKVFFNMISKILKYWLSLATTSVGC